MGYPRDAQSVLRLRSSRMIEHVPDKRRPLEGRILTGLVDRRRPSCEHGSEARGQWLPRPSAAWALRPALAIEDVEARPIGTVGRGTNALHAEALEDLHGGLVRDVCGGGNLRKTEIAESVVANPTRCSPSARAYSALAPITECSSNLGGTPLDQWGVASLCSRPWRVTRSRATSPHLVQRNRQE